MSESPKILIIRLSSLGDILHALPSFHSLRRTYPAARIHWLIERRFAHLLDVVDGIDRVIPVDTAALRANMMVIENWRRLIETIRTMRGMHYDVAIDFQGLLKTAGLTLASGAKSRIGFSKTLVRERPAHWFYNRTVAKPPVPLHIASINLLLAEAAGARSSELTADIRPRAEDVRNVQDHLAREQLSTFIVINPGGGWPTKKWPPARYGALAARIQSELRMPVVVVTGPGEESLYREIAGNCSGRPPAHFPVPFLELIPLFQRAQLVISGDTGPLHLACALRVPVVAIMGPTSPVRNGPWSADDRAVVHQLPCSFCNGRSCPTQNECMDIRVEEVFNAVVSRLEKEK